MSKKNLILTIICCLAFMIIGGVAGYFIADNDSLANADDYIKNTILPVILGSGTGGGIFAIAMTLILNSLKVATNNFGTSSEKLNSAYKLVSDQNLKLIEDSNQIKSYNEILQTLMLEVETLKKMLQTGLCNTEELVKSGIATEIARISEHTEEKPLVEQGGEDNANKN